MLRITSLRFVFYSPEKSVVTQVRELSVSPSTNLSDLVLALPEGNYKLVVIANPTTKLVARTAVGSPLSQLTGYEHYYTDELATQGSQLTVSLLNEQGPVTVTSAAFVTKAWLLKSQPMNTASVCAKVPLSFAVTSSLSL